MPKCRFCGTENSENAEFCINCGKKISKIKNTIPPLPEKVPEIIECPFLFAN